MPLAREALPTSLGRHSTQNEFLIELKLNGFWGVLLFLLDLEISIWEVK